MASKQSGLGRGLDDLLGDNAPEIRTGKGSVVVRNGQERIRVTPPESKDIAVEKPLFDEVKKNRSVKANFRK